MNRGHFAVIVGINRYPGLPSSLKHAKKDAQDFYEWLVDPEGGAVPKENIHLVMVDADAEEGFADHTSSRPSREEIDDELSRVNVAVQKLVEAEPDLWDETRLYFYASGHGIAPIDGIGALLSAKSVFNEYESRYDNLELDAYRRWYLNARLFHEVVVFADCCREYRPLTPGGGPPFDNVMRAGRSVAWALGFATQPGELALEPAGDADDMRGYFTHALMDGLRGGAADPETGEIRTDMLARYVAESLDCQLEGRPFKQQSNIAGSYESVIVLRPPGVGKLPKKKRTVTLCVESDAPRELVLYRGIERTPHELTRDAGTVKLKLVEDRYQVRAADGTVVKTLKDEGSFAVYGVDRNVNL